MTTRGYLLICKQSERFLENILKYTTNDGVTFCQAITVIAEVEEL